MIESCTYYPIEEQIDDCFAILGFDRKNAEEMSEEEMHDAERELEKYFEWKERCGYVHLVPYLKATGECVIDIEIRKERAER